MDYEKKYKEALEKARQLCAYPTTKPFISDLQDLFPELKESEDERIRKEIIKYFKKYQALSLGDYNIQDILDWLEKQGEQKSLDEIAKEVTKDKDAAVSFLKSTGIINENGELADEYKIEQGEQKFSWSEEDKKMSRFIGNAITADDASTYLESKGIQVIDAHVWLDELKDRVQLKQEWSEEDGKIIIQIKKALEDFFSASETDKIKYWLNSLKDRVQPQLKQVWSDVDKDILFRTIDNLKFLKDTISTDPKYAVNIIDIEREITWLKSLRPQNNATDEELAQARKDAYNDALDKIEYHSGEPTFDDGWSAAIWYLKKRNAQPQNTWKPSDEQMNALWSATEKYLESDNENVRKLRGEVLESLYEDLKKLKG